MNALLEFLARGGPAMIAILALSVVLYAHCFQLLLVLRRARRTLPRVADAHSVRLQVAWQESFRQRRMALGAMIAAAPLLGLLGTVGGMVRTFASLSTRGSDQSMEGLARGIAEVLVATESGLLVALPALLLVYLAHREVRRLVAALNRLEPADRRTNP